MTLRDQASRDLIANDLGTSFFVQAGAGSGKTTSLVSRIVNLVSKGTDLSKVIAITFTEKSSADLQKKIRQDIQKSKDIDQAAKNIALEQLNLAPIGTIHSFASRLISEFPVRAGVPPLITVVDELGSQIAFERRWEAIELELFAADAPIELRASIYALMAQENRVFDELPELAQSIDDNWEKVHSLAGRPYHDVSKVDLANLLEAKSQLEEMLAICSNPDDKLYVRMSDCLPQLELLQEMDKFKVPATRIIRALINNFPNITKANRGTPGSWGGNEGKEKALRAYQGIGVAKSKLLEAISDSAIDNVISYLSAKLLDLATQRRRRGFLEFNDLLVIAKELFTNRDSDSYPDFARQISEKYQWLFLDEVQDTDPSQVEIALGILECIDFVAEEDGLPAPTGRLFVVGDGKQSIYRFRSADIAMFQELEDRFKSDTTHDVLPLTTNFRSEKEILDWVNFVFDKAIKFRPNLQVDFDELDPKPENEKQGSLVGPPVSLLGLEIPQTPDGKTLSAGEVRGLEAEEVAKAILEATGKGSGPAWTILKKNEIGGDRYVEANLEDICVLLPSRTSLNTLEKALQKYNIPYRTEASSLIYSSTEVNELLNALRAISNPADELSLVLALRSSLFGVSDVELFTWHETQLQNQKDGSVKSGPWNLFGDFDSESNPKIAAALDILRELAKQSSYLKPNETLDALIAQTSIVELQFKNSSPRAMDTVRKLRFVSDQALAWSEATHGSLRDYLKWAARQADENARVKEVIVPETDTDAVRIMTVHASKGLEFPIVIASGSSGKSRIQPDTVLWHRRPEDRADIIEVQLKSNSFLATQGYGTLYDEEKVALCEEFRRLAYVSCTRAESHLIVSMYRTEGMPEKDGTGFSFGSLISSALTVEQDEQRPSFPFGAEAYLPLPEEAVTVPKPVETWSNWEKKFEARKYQTTATSLSVTNYVKSEGKYVPLGKNRFVPVAGERLPRVEVNESISAHGSEIGTAVHKIIELSLLRDKSDLTELATSLVSAELVKPVVAMAEVALNFVRSNYKSDKLHSEVPILTSRPELNDTVLEGVVDLLVETEQGELVVVDFKTDFKVSDATFASHWKQLECYANILSEQSGKRVKETQLIYCSSAGVDVMSRSLAK
jgi:ATP-dependent helicase/nuclease subunit A